MGKGKEFKHFVGIDVSKNWLDITVLDGSRFVFHTRIENSSRAIRAFTVSLETRGMEGAGCLFCAENTGIYNEHLKGVSQEMGLFLWIEKPLRIIRSQGMVRGKNDKVDSRRIAMYAYKNVGEAKGWVAPRKVLQSTRRLVVLRRNLMGSLKQPAQVLGEKDFLGGDTKLLGKACRKSLDAIRADISAIEKQILELIKADAALSHKYGLVTSVGGVGMFTAVEVLISTNEFKNFDDAKKFACYCGVVPFEYSSGTSIRKRPRVSPMANTTMKTLLHMAAMSAIRMKGELKDYFVRKVNEGKNKMLVLNAVRNKIILRIFAVVKKDQHYQKDFSFSFA